MKKVAIIILNWNGKENTLECIKSIEKLQMLNPPAGRAGVQCQIYVVDNGSTDGSVETFNKLQTTNYDLKVIENKKNLGFCEGNNVGMRKALKDGNDLVMILNNDTLLDGKLAFQLIETFDKYPDAGIVSPKIYFAPGFEFHKGKYKKSELGKVIWYAGGLIDWNNVFSSHRGVDEVDRGQHDKVTETDYASGACFLVKKEVLQKIGLFDKDYFLYWEDADLSERAKRAGFKVLYAPPAHLWHKNAGSSRVGGALHDYYLIRNRLLFGAKYASLRARFALLRESLKFLVFGRPWQRRAVLDYYFGNMGKGSFEP